MGSSDNICIIYPDTRGPPNGLRPLLVNLLSVLLPSVNKELLQLRLVIPLSRIGNPLITRGPAPRPTYEKGTFNRKN